jgi:hypothetical protein
VVSIDRSETDTWYLAADAETSKWETVTGGIAYNDGNVGIGTGTASPDATLTVKPQSAAIGTHENQNWSYDSTSTGVEFDLKLKQVVSSGLVKYKFDLRNSGTSYDNNLVLDRGNVGIGTSDPNRTLTVSSASGVPAELVSSSTNSLLAFFDANTGVRPSLGSEGGDLVFNANGERLRINDSGDFLVGSGSRTYTVGSGAYELDIAGGLNLSSGRDNGASMTFEVSNSERLRIDAGGTTTVTGGFEAAQAGAGAGAFAAGTDAGVISQSASAVAVGNGAGYTGQKVNAVAVGLLAGRTDQQADSVAVGRYAGNATQGQRSVAVGSYSAQTNQGEFAVALGDSAGKTNQGFVSVAVGHLAGKEDQGEYALAVGYSAGATNQQSNAIAIGNRAGQTNQAANGIIISSRGSAESSANPNHIYIVSGSDKYLYYNGTNSWTFAGGPVTASDFTASSDERLKSDITTAPSVVDQLHGREWTWKADGKKGSGVIAQELEAVLPHLVHEDDEGMKSVSYQGLVAYLIEEVKGLKREIEELKS